MSRGNNPFYWIHESLRFGRMCAVKYPIAAPLFPVVACTVLGFVSLEITNGRNGSLNGHPESPSVAAKGVVQYDEAKPDPYSAHAEASKSKKKHKTWQAQYVQDMLDGLKHKTRKQKIEDAVDAMNHFMENPGKK